MFKGQLYFPEAAITNYHNSSGLKQQKFILIVLEARNIKSKCRLAVFLLRALGENLSLPLPDSGGSRHPYSMAASLQSQPLSIHRCLLFSLWISLLFPIKIALNGFKAPLDNMGWSHLQNLNYIHKGPFSKLDHIHRFQGLGCRYIIW